MSTTVEHWTISDISNAISSNVHGNKQIEVPMFQRNLVWTKDQKSAFIDSVKKGFPVGSLLFYEIKNKNNTYSLIDGLQRSSTISDFINNPTLYFSVEDIDDITVNNLFELYNLSINGANLKLFSEQVRTEIRKIVAGSKIDSLNLLPNIAKEIVEKYSSNQNPDVYYKTMGFLEPCISSFKRNYDDVARFEVPILIFTGEESDLPTVFERINNQGTMLGKYQIYAATWAVSNYSIKVENEEIIKHITDKYDAFVDQGYVLQNYDRDDITTNKELSYFEYVLGLGKYLSNKYPYLFEGNKDVQEINQVGFELLNACFGKHNKDLKNLNEELHRVDINLLEKDLISTIDDVNTILTPYIEFKGNVRSTINIFHSSNQMVSIIASTFREKFTLDNLLDIKSDWQTKLAKLRISLPQHYVFDIISHNWAEGAFGKIYSILNDNKYLNTIKFSLWEAKLNEYFENLNTRSEKKNVASPKSIEKLFLNCVHLNTFTAFEQLSYGNFDIEHIIPKDKLKNIINSHDWNGLPISSIGNLCYLPEYTNRAKGANTIYEDASYIKHINKSNISLKDIEDKYTFTEETDLDWLYHKADGTFYGDDDYDIFAESYSKFLVKHFGKMKKYFYQVLHVDLVNLED